jgi:hypothetical protein
MNNSLGKTALGPGHPNVAESLDDLVELLQATNRLTANLTNQVASDKRWRSRGQDDV